MIYICVCIYVCVCAGYYMATRPKSPYLFSPLRWAHQAGTELSSGMVSSMKIAMERMMLASGSKLFLPPLRVSKLRQIYFGRSHFSNSEKCGKMYIFFPDSSWRPSMGYYCLTIKVVKPLMMQYPAFLDLS